MATGKVKTVLPIPEYTANIPTNALIPFSEPPYLAGLPSPYYNESHYRWQKTCRNFISKTLHEQGLEWENNEDVPLHVFKAFGDNNFLVPNFPAPLPLEQLRAAGIHELPGGLKIEDFDYFHFLIYTDEMLRLGLSGPPGAITTGAAFGIPPLFKFGSKYLQEKYLPDLFSGKIRCCIAITEPSAGSDVANIQTTAVKSECGKFYIVNGQKKWITNGVWSDYATMAVRTGGKGGSGLSLMWVPLLNHPGVEMRRLKQAGQRSGGTTFIELDDVKVPVENLIGVEGMGMKYVMTNFNHERLSISIGTTRQARVALSAAVEYTMKREAFGKALMEQPVVRHRLAKAGALLETQWAWVEQFTYMMTKLPKPVADVELGGLTAMAKAQAGFIFNECAQTAVLLFGGNAFTRTGQGELVEKLYREVPGTRIPGGSEDVMYDLAIRQLVKNFKAKTAELEKTRGSKI